MNTRLLQQLSGLFRSKSSRKQRTRDRSSQIQRLENRHLLTAPTLDVIYDLTVAEDSGERSVALSGITAGANENQPLRVTATSSNTVVIATPSIDYNSPNSTGTLRFTPIANRWGNSIITVTVEDGGPDANLSTSADNESFSRTFRVAVTAVNDLPTLNPISDRTISEDAAQQTVALSGIGAGPFESQPLRVTATSSNTAIIPNPTVTYTGPQATGSIRFTPNANRFGTVTITVSVEDGGLDSNFNTPGDNATFSRSFTVTISSVNDAPTMNAISDLTITEDPGEQSVSVTGISAGPFETQALVLTATSDNAGLIPDPTVEYTSPNSSAVLKFTPVANLSGTAVITVTLRDPGQDEDPATTADNLEFTRTFTVTVTSVNDAPTLDVIADVTISEDDGEQVVNLTGITAGPLESQSLRVSATSSNTGLIPNPAVTYTSPDAVGSLRFTPVADQSGSATITVLVEDAGPDGDFNTAADNASYQRTFTVTVNAVNDAPLLDAINDVSIAEDAAEQTVNLTGIFAGGGESQTLRVTVSSSDTSLIPTPSVTYTSPNATGSIRFTPASDLSGSATITVTVEDPGADGDIDTVGDNATTSRTFLVTVAPENDAPTLDSLSNLLLTRDAASQTVNLSGITAGGGETQPLQVTASSSNTALIPDPAVTYSSADPTGSISFTPVAGMSGSAVITVTVTDGGLDGDLSTTGDNGTTSQTFTVYVNDPPTANAISDVTINEDVTEQTVSLTGISAGTGESSQKVRITATSGDTTLIPVVNVDYTLFAVTAALRFTPATDLSGSSLITVTLEDAGIDGDFDTTEDNQSSTRTFTVTVTPVNDAPTLNAPADLTIDEDAGEQTVNLSGISAGGGESQSLRVSATSSNTTLIAAVDVTYSSPQATGSLKFTPAADASGSAIITVTVTDPGDDGTFETADDASVSKSFTVTVNPVNDLPTLAPVFDVTIDEDSPEQSISLEGITAGGGETQILRVSASSDVPGLIPNPVVDYSSPDATGTLRYQPVANQFGTAIITVLVEDAGPDGDFNTTGDNATLEVTFSVTVNPVNDVPTLDSIADVTIDEDAPEQTVNLTGIFAGGGESQPLQISVSSSNTSLIPDPSVNYTSDNQAGSISFTPATDQFGTVTITVTVTDGGLDGMLDTTDDNASFSRTFLITVNAVNDVPTVDQPADLTLDEDAAEQTLTLTGITAGGGESQPLSVSFTNSNAALFSSISLIYSSPESNADLIFTPTPDTSGTATITFTVEDGGLDLDLSTTADNATTEITFVITVAAVNDAPTIDPLYELSVDEDSAETSLNFSGITAGPNESQPLMVVATSSDTAIVPDPTVIYSSANTTGSIRFQPLPNAHGVVEITVTVIDGGLDGNLNTSEDNGTTTQIFTLTVRPINDPPSIAPIADVTVSEDAPEQTLNLTGITSGPLEFQPARITASSSNPGLVPDPSITYSTPDTTGTLKFQPVADQSGTAVITVRIEDGGDDSKLETPADNVIFSITFTITVTAVNDVPTLDTIGNLTIDEDAAEQTVNLTGIAAGGGETQPLSIAATSSNTELIADPTVVYSSADATGSLKFTPNANQSGSAVVTVTVTDGGLDGDLSTTNDNASVTLTFTVTVNPVNDAPTLDQPDAVTIDEDAPEHTVSLTGIAAGGGENQPLSITATSDNTALIADPTVTYSSADPNGSLSFTPVANLSGSAVITVTVTDGGLDGDLSTTEDNASVTLTFTVTVNPVNDAPTLDQPDDVTIDEDAPEYTVSLTGITAGGGEDQPLSITATSDNTALIADPTVTYSSADPGGSLSFTPVADLSGSAVITVTVTDGGLDGDLSTTEDNGSVTLTFTVTVNPVNDAPTLDQPFDLTIDEDDPEQTVSITGIAAGGGEDQPLSITATSSDTSIIADPTVVYSSADPTGSLVFTPTADQSGVVVISVTVTDGGLDGDLSTTEDNASVTLTFTVTVNPVNDAPTLDQPDDVTIDEDAPEHTVSLTGIAAGGGENQPLSITATSDNTALIADPTVSYSSADPNGSLRFTPVANLSGSAVITVTVTDGGLDGDLSTTEDNASVTLTFTVTVNPVNDAPTLDQPFDLTIDEDDPEQTVSITGIAAGGGEDQPLSITATSSDTSIIADPTVLYNSADPTGSLVFTPVTDQSGVVVISVTVTDGGLDGDLSTTDDNGSVTLTFTVTVNPVNDAPTLDQPDDVTIDEDAPEQTVTLTGIAAGGGENQPLSITATSSDTSIIADPTVVYNSADPTGSLVFTPVADQSGVVVISVTVTDGGLDGDLSTTEDNASVTLTFTVTVNPVNDAPTLDQPDDVTIDEDAPEYTVSLTGIAAGGGEDQPLSITATSDNTALIADPTVTYSSADPNGSLSFTPVADLSGSAVITVTVTDGGLDGDLSTTEDNGSVTLTFTVTVNPVNDAPTLDQPFDVTIDEDAPEQIVTLTGIAAGGGEDQPLSITATSSDTSIIADPTVVYSSADPTGSLVFTPVADQNGVVVISVTVTDGGLDGDLSTSEDNGSVTLTFTVTVNPVNDAPTLDQPDDVTIDEDAPEYTVGPTGISAGGGENQPLSITATSDNTALIADPTVFYSPGETEGALSFTPVANQSGTAVITVTVTDGGLDGDLSTIEDNASVTRTFNVTVNPVNDAPTLDQPDDVTIDEDAPEHSVSLTGITAGGGEDQPLSITATSDNTALIADPTVVYSSADATGSLSFTPVADLSGSAVITVVVTDGGLDGDLSTTEDNGSVTLTFTVTVNPVNDAPTLDQPDDVTIDEDAPEQTVTLTGIAAGGGENQPLSITATSSDTSIIADPTVVYSSADPTGSLVFTPVADQSGVVVISVTVTDGGLDGDLSTTEDNSSVTLTFTVTVNPVNDAPTLDQPDNVTIDEDAPEYTVSLTGIAAGGGEDQPLSITATSSNTELIADPTVVYSSADPTGSLSFTPVADLSGSAVITVTVTDGGLDGDLSTTEDNSSVTLTFTVTVNPVNDAPTLDQPFDVTIDEDAPEQTVTLTGIAAGGGEDQPISITATSSDTSIIADPTVVYSSADPSGSLVFIPVADQNGVVVISVTVTDGGLDGDLSTTEDNASVTLTFTVTVNPVNDAPTLDQPDDVTIDEDAPEHTVSLTGIAAGGGENQPLSITATSDNTALIADPTVSYSSADPNGSLSFTPVANLSGSAVITVTVTDGGLDGDLSTTEDNGSVTLTFTVTVNPVNDAPTLDQPDGVTIDEDAPEHSVSLTGIAAGGGEDQPLSITATSDNTELIADPTVVYSSADATGSLSFTPVADLSGSAVITVVVTDGGLDGDLSTTEDNGSVTLTFTVTVNPVNDAPTLDQPDDVTIDEDAPEHSVSLTGITAGGGEDQPLSITATSDNTLLVPNPSVVFDDLFHPELQFTPATNQNGTAVITVVVTDGGLDGDLSTTDDNSSVTRTFTVTVNAVNDSPTLDPVSDISVLEDSTARTVPLTGITAGGGETQPLRITATSSNTALIPNPSIIYSSPDASGSLQFTPVTNTRGSAVITVMIEDGGPDEDLSTTDDNLTTTRTLTVTVTPIRAVIISPTGSVMPQRPVIQWTAVPSAVSYDVWIGNVSAGLLPLLQANSTSTSFLPTVDLGIGKIDAYVRGVRSDGSKMPWSAVQRFTIVTQLVPNPLNPTQTNVRPTVTWPAITGAVRYEVDVDDISRGNFDFVRTTVTTTSWTHIQNLAIGLYRFYARALAKDGTPGTWSTALDFTIATAPQAIAPVTATFNRLQEFSWTPVLGATSYRLQLRSETKGQTVHDVSGITATRWTPLAPLSDGNYSWVVAGFTSAGDILGTFSTRSFFYVGGRPTITAPIGTAGSTRPTLQWQNVLGAASYQVQLNRRFADGSETVVFNIPGITTNSFTPVNPLVSGATYRFWVRAVSSTGGFSIWSVPVTFTVAVAEAPATAPAEIPSLQLALLESPLDTPANSVRKTAVTPAVDTRQLVIEAAEPVLTASVITAPAAARAELGLQTADHAELASIDDTISDVVDLLLSGGILLN